MSTIAIEGMEFYAYHGCFTEEQIIGTKFIVDLFIDVETKDAEISDDISKTVNYQAVYRMVKEEMEVKSKLLEHVARRILDRLFTDFPKIIKAHVKVSKLNPPVGGKVHSVSVTI
jgi:dihydroneopterin aldolase